MNTFEITIQRKAGKSWPVVTEYSRTGVLLPIRAEGRLALEPEDFQALTSLLGQPQAYGARLGQALFRDAVRDAFVGALRESEDRLRVLLCVEHDADAADTVPLHTLHWERLCAPLDGVWALLALDQRTPFSLYIPSTTDRRFLPMGRRDLRALVLVASPTDSARFNLAPFDVEATVASIGAALGDIPYDVLAAVAGASGPPTLDDLCQRLTDRQQQYTLLHVVCHGRRIANGETVLYWAKADNHVQPVTGTELLAQLSRIRGPRGLPPFAFLAMCESAGPEAEGAFEGLAQRLVRELGVPAVVAMTDKVTMQTAQAIAERFYRHLRASGEVDVALPEATAGLGQRSDVIVPALFSRLGGRPLFSDQLDRALSNAEIAFGLDRLRALITERAPGLQEECARQATMLQQTLEVDATALSKEGRQEREQALREVNALAEDVLDLSFNALALGQQPPVYDARCPFRGLYPFRIEDREFFFGREILIEQLRQKLAEQKFLAVLGPSGSGKSSVVLAGLLPALQRREPGLQVASLTPDSEPLLPLETALSKLSDQSGVLVVDQFEELFTLCADEKRREFIGYLLRTVRSRRVVLTMRADFWGECAPYEELKQLMERCQTLMAPMDSTELRKAMDRQASQVGLRFEAGLSNRILDDVQGEPGAMPLLQHALRELWNKRHGRWLRSAEYDAIGGVKKAIAQTADKVYDSLAPPEQQQMQNIFVRLTRLDVGAVQGEQRRDTRRRVWLEELVPAGGDRAVTGKLVQRLAGEEARLVVTSVHDTTYREAVEVAHEALIRYWPRLQRWLDENRANLLLRDTIRQAAEEWDQHAKEESYLIHRGGRLNDAEALTQQSGFLNKLETDYVQACVDLREHLRRQEEERRERERRRLRVAVVVFAVLALLASMGAWVALEQKQRADVQSQVALARQLAAQANRFADLASDDAAVERAGALAAESWKRLHNLEASDAASKLLSMLPSVRIEHGSDVWSVTFSPDGRLLATGSKDNIARLIAIPSGREVARIEHGGAVWSVTFSPDGRFLVTGSADHMARLIETAPGTQASPRIIEHGGEVDSVVVSPDGRFLATGSADKTARLIAIPSGQEVARIAHGDEVGRVAFSPDSRWLATGSWDNMARLIAIPSGQEVARIAHGGTVLGLAFSPDGQFLVTGSADNMARLIAIPSGREVARIEHGGAVQSVAVSPNSRFLATGSWDNMARLIEIPSGREVARIEHGYKVWSVDISPNGRLLATGSWDNMARLIEISSGREVARLPHGGAVKRVVFSPNGQFLATGSMDNTARLLETAYRGEVARLVHDGAVRSIAFSLNGRFLATGSADNTARLVEIASGREIARVLHDGEVYSVDVSPDGQFLATGSADNTARLVETASGREIARVPHDGAVESVAFNPDGRFLATGSADNTARLFAIPSGREVARLVHDGAVWSVALSLDGRFLATGSADNTARLMETAHGTEVARVLHDGAVYGVALSLDGRFLATGSADNTARLFAIPSGREVARLAHGGAVWSVALSPDGRFLATGSADHTARLFEIPSGREIAPHLEHSGAVRSVAVSPNSRWLATGSADNTARLFEIPSGREVARIEHGGAVSPVFFSPDGRFLATGSVDKMARLVWADPQHLFDLLCTKAGQNLSQGEWASFLGPGEPWRPTCTNWR